MYEQALADFKPAEVAESVRRLIRRSEFPPSIAEIVRETVERELALPSAVEAVAQITRGVTAGRDEFHPLVYAARSAVGDSWAWRTTETPQIMVAQARKAYESLREETIRRRIDGDPPLALDAAPC